MAFKRYALYYTPPPGQFADLGAAWLGWDIATGHAVGTPDPAIVGRPRRYGFHATLKAPFFLADGCSEDDLKSAFEVLAQTQCPVRLDGLEITPLGGFVALVPVGNTDALEQLAAQCVAELDRFRAPMSEAERQRKTKPNMSAAHQQNLDNWGYAHVMDAFRFHMTLTGPLSKAVRRDVISQAQEHFAPISLSPLKICGIALVGETEAGTFVTIKRATLDGLTLNETQPG